MSEGGEASDAAELGRSYRQVVDKLPREADAPDAQTISGEPETAATPPSPQRIIEALLFVGAEPLTPARAKEIIRGLTEEQFHQILQHLNQDYKQQGRPYAIVLEGPGYILSLKPRFRGVAEKLYGAVREARLSNAAVDVLALIAYRQPATKQEIDSLRGAESGSLLRQLVRRGLATVVRRADAHQREVSYGTTDRFLELFGLSSLEDLPRTQDLQQI
jgi:segregation and condensation protein B